MKKIIASTDRIALDFSHLKGIIKISHEADPKKRRDTSKFSIKFLFDKDENRLLGLIQVRLELKGYLVEFGGHIGYCVRPAERRKGYAKEMLRQALAISKKEGLTKVMVTCLEDNIGSAKTIEACDGIYEKTVFDDLNYKANLKRYWITI